MGSRLISSFALAALAVIVAWTGPGRIVAGADRCPDLAPGRIAVEHLAAQPAAPGQSLWLVRLRFGPKASLPYRTNAGATVALVENGTVGVTAVAGAIRVIRAGDAAPDVPVLGTESRLTSGDAAFYGPDVEHLIRNPAAEPASLLLTTLAPDDRPPYATAVTVGGAAVCVQTP